MQCRNLIFPIKLNVIGALAGRGIHVGRGDCVFGHILVGMQGEIEYVSVKLIGSHIGAYKGQHIMACSVLCDGVLRAELIEDRP